MRIGEYNWHGLPPALDSLSLYFRHRSSLTQDIWTDPKSELDPKSKPFWYLRLLRLHSLTSFRQHNFWTFWTCHNWISQRLFKYSYKYSNKLRREKQNVIMEKSSELHYQLWASDLHPQWLFVVAFNNISLTSSSHLITSALVHWLYIPLCNMKGFFHISRLKFYSDIFW